MFCALAFLLFIAEDRSSSQEVMREAVADLKAGKDNVAGQLLTGLLAAEPANAPAHNLLGLVFMKQRHFAEAEEEFKAAIRLDPNSAASHTNFGNALVQLHRDSEAEGEYQRAPVIKPEDEPAV